jgi:hypothetical protein
VNLRTRKWGCALGITLLTAVVIALAAWFGQGLAGPASAQDTLRAIPLSPGASQPVYTRPGELNWTVKGGDVAGMTYQVNDPPDDVRDFYNSNLPSRGWDSFGGTQDPAAYFKHEEYVSGLGVTESAPWIHMQLGIARNSLFVQAERVERDGVELTEVNVKLIVHVEPNYRYIP